MSPPGGERRPTWLWLVAAAVVAVFVLVAAAAGQWAFALVGLLVAAVAVAPLFSRR